MALEFFDLFEIPVQLRVPSGSLSQKFFELSRKYHPDYFVQQGEKEQAGALEKSAMLNKAFRTFQNTDDTIRYVLMQKGLMQEEEKYELPSDFLMEVLEINEQLMDIDNQAANAAVRSTIDKLQSEIYEPVKDIVEHYQEGVTSEKELLQVKEYYYKKKYLDRIRRQLAGMA